MEVFKLKPGMTGNSVPAGQKVGSVRKTTPSMVRTTVAVVMWVTVMLAMGENDRRRGEIIEGGREEKEMGSRTRTLDFVSVFKQGLGFVAL